MRTKVGIAQIAPIQGDLDANAVKHEYFIREAEKQGVEFLLFPELSLTGYEVPLPHKIACPVEHELIRSLGSVSKKVTCAFGFMEMGYAAQMHNSFAVFHDEKLLYLHRKLNLANYGKLNEGKSFAQGRYLESFDLTEPWRASILICADMWNPALAHLAAVSGTTLMLAPINSAKSTVSENFSNFEGWKLVTRFYAMIYGMPIMMANRVGVEDDKEFWGHSQIIGPCGDVLKMASHTDEELLVTNLYYKDVIEARAMLPTVRDSNLDLIHREFSRLRDKIGHPEAIKS